MSRESIRSLLQSKGSFPGEAEVRANFEALFRLAGEGAHSVADLAWGFRQALDQWSQVDAVVDASVAQRLRDWALAHWSPDSYERCKELGAVLLNVATPETLRFLDEQRAAATDPDLQRLLDDFIALHPRQGGEG